MSDPATTKSSAVPILVGLAAIGAVFAVFSNAGESMHFSNESGAPRDPPPSDSSESGQSTRVPANASPSRRNAPGNALAPTPASQLQHSNSGGNGEGKGSEPARVAPMEAAASPAPPAPLTPAVEGSANIDKEDVRAAISKLKPQLAGCYEEAVAKNPALAGKVTVEFTLKRDVTMGSVPADGAIADSTLNAPLVEACILEKLRAAKFPEMKGEGTVKVRYPFVFANSVDGG